MRVLSTSELAAVGGGVGQCTPSNSYGGVRNPRGFGGDLINIYEGLVSFTSHVIERVARVW